jgi:hypothetical protein
MVIRYKENQCPNCLSTIKENDKRECKKCGNLICKYCKCFCKERKSK